MGKENNIELLIYLEMLEKMIKDVTPAGEHHE